MHSCVQTTTTPIVSYLQLTFSCCKLPTAAYLVLDLMGIPFLFDLQFCIFLGGVALITKKISHS